MSKSFFLQAFFLFFLLVFPALVFGGRISVPLDAVNFITDAQKTVVDGGVSFEIDKRAAILIKLPRIERLNINYEADGYFRLSYASATEGFYKIDPHFLMGRALSKGEGRVDVDLRHTVYWSPEAYPFLLLEGTGKFQINNVNVTTVSDDSAYIKKKNSAFFWRPEVARVSTMNFLTPIYWDFSRRIPWPLVLGCLFLITIAGAVLLGFYRRTDYTRHLPAISIIFMLVYGVHFIARFAPMASSDALLSDNEKISKNYMKPEFGWLAATAREKVNPADRVAFMGEEADWFSPEALCFNIAPVKCVFYKSENAVYYGISDTVSLPADEINIIVSYNSDHELPAGFKRKHVLNKNVFIAVKK